VSGDFAWLEVAPPASTVGDQQVATIVLPSSVNSTAEPSIEFASHSVAKSASYTEIARQR
jgi:hypothetical protein